MAAPVPAVALRTTGLFVREASYIQKKLVSLLFPESDILSAVGEQDVYCRNYVLPLRDSKIVYLIERSVSTKNPIRRRIFAGTANWA